jgi:hypothetical protein
MLIIVPPMGSPIKDDARHSRSLAHGGKVIDWLQYVSYWPKADMTVRDSDVRFRG